MILSSSGENAKFIYGIDKSPLYTICGDVKTEYVEETKTYKMTRVDGKPFDGTEELELTFIREEIKDTHTLVEHEVNGFTAFQTIPEANLFDSFYYYITDDKLSIIIEPIYEKRSNIVMQLPDDGTHKGLNLSIAKHKKGIKK